jgi:hypothetical protein
MTTAITGAPTVTSEQANWFARAFGALVSSPCSASSTSSGSR